jgi:serine/threonine-protein kinase RsbW
VTGAYPVLHLCSFASARRVRSARTWTRTFHGAPASVPEARSFAAELLAGCPAREVLLMCVSELCANAIRHTDSGSGGVFILEVGYPRDGVARVAVTDEGSSSVPEPRARDVTAESGRGLALVAACTSRWGYADAYPGRTVWAEASWPVPVPSPDPAPSPGRGVPARTSRRARTPFPPVGRRSRIRRPPSPAPPTDWSGGPAA